MRSSKATRHLPEIQRGAAFNLIVDGKEIEAYPGETVAAALVASGIKIFQHTDDGLPRGVYCGIGQCFSCLVTVNGKPGIRACLTLACPGMYVLTNSGEEA